MSDDCTCVFYHPKDKTKVKQMLEEARRVGDSVAIVIALAQLAPCRTRNKK